MLLQPIKYLGGVASKIYCSAQLASIAAALGHTSLYRLGGD